MEAMIAYTRPPMLHVVASLVRIGSVAMLYWPESQMSNELIQCLVFLSSRYIVFCTDNMVSKNSQQHSIPMFASAALGMLYGTCYSGIFCLLMGYGLNIEVTTRNLVSLVWLTVVFSVLNFSYYWC